MLMLDVSMQVGAAANQQVADPYANEPKRHPALVVRSQQPFNAETPVDVLGTSGLTPNELFYVRNHLPVPHVEPASWSVSLTSALQFTVCH
jgi:sulfite oxidase